MVTKRFRLKIFSRFSEMVVTSGGFGGDKAEVARFTIGGRWQRGRRQRRRVAAAAEAAEVA